MEGKNTKVYANLESVVNLKDQSLHGYWVLTRILSGNSELSFKDIVDKDLRAQAETMVLKAVAKKVLTKPIFIKKPIAMDLEYLPVISKNFVVCLPQDMKLADLAEAISFLRKSGLKSALDGYSTIGYEVKEFRVGTFDYVFFSEDFYTNTKISNLERLIANLKLFKVKLGFKNIDSLKKLNLALKLGIDVGHGYFFGSESFLAGILE
ncbi:MAG: diguanylate phosphodiesterase [Aquificaceae bacterium]